MPEEKRRAMALSAASYLEKYFDCVDTMPLELQRSMTRLREIELQHRRLLGDVDVLRVQMEGAVAGGNEREVCVAIQRLHHCMLAVRELGNMKMEVSSQLLDTVEEYGQQLSLCAKELDSPSRGHDDHHHHSPRHTSTSSHGHNHNGKNDSQLVQSEMASEKTAAKRTSSAKKPRTSQVEKPREREDTPPIIAGLSHENNTNSGGGGGGGGGGGLGGVVSGNKLPRKKIKAKKKATKEPAANLPDPSQVPMPDLSSQPLDPDEPLYCHCQQVSFGEMIGCDNDDCPIEWFHFQCVGLTSKPKGKWYCPQCAPDRKTKNSK